MDPILHLESPRAGISTRSLSLPPLRRRAISELQDEERRAPNLQLLGFCGLSLAEKICGNRSLTLLGKYFQAFCCNRSLHIFLLQIFQQHFRFAQDGVCRICQEKGDKNDLGVFCEFAGNAADNQRVQPAIPRIFLYAATAACVWAWLWASRHCDGVEVKALSEMLSSCTSDASLGGWLRATAGATGIGLLVPGLSCEASAFSLLDSSPNKHSLAVTRSAQHAWKLPRFWAMSDLEVPRGESGDGSPKERKERKERLRDLKCRFNDASAREYLMMVGSHLAKVHLPEFPEMGHLFPDVHINAESCRAGLVRLLFSKTFHYFLLALLAIDVLLVVTGLQLKIEVASLEGIAEAEKPFLTLEDAHECVKQTDAHKKAATLELIDHIFAYISIGILGVFLVENILFMIAFRLNAKPSFAAETLHCQEEKEDLQELHESRMLEMIAAEEEEEAKRAKLAKLEDILKNSRAIQQQL
eukprot:Skav201855  [mRNA]  locus=scaffold484:383326:391132:- [translate_table: standard]